MSEDDETFLGSLSETPSSDGVNQIHLSSSVHNSISC